MSLIDQYKQIFIQAVKNVNIKTNPEQIGGDWDVFGTAQGVIGAQQASDIKNAENSAFIQTQNGNQLTLSAFSRGIVPQRGAIPATCVITNAVFPVTSFTLNEGEQFTSNANGEVYTLIAKTTISISEATPLSLQSQKLGAGLQVPTASTFQNVLTQSLQYIVASSNDGEDEEGEDEFRKRLLQAVQTFAGAGREGDFQRIAFEAAPGAVTGVQTILDFNASTGAIGVFVLSGSSDFNAILLNPAAYNRTATPDVVTQVTNFINAFRGIEQRFIAGSVSTFFPTNIIVINVRLVTGFSLSTTVSNFNGDSITVENFILQEFRRALITYPTGATEATTGNFAFLLLSRIEQTLDSSLSESSGVFGNFIVDREILVSGVVQDIPVPFNSLNINGNLRGIYDINVANTSVGLL